MFKLSLSPLFLALSLVSMHGGEVAVALQSAPPEGNTLIAFENERKPNALGWFHTETARRDIAQAFAVEQAMTMQSITLRIHNVRNNFNTASEFTLEIYENSSASSNPKHGRLVHTGSGSLHLTRGNQEMYLSFTLDQPVELSAGLVYAVVLSLQTPSSTNILSFVTNEGHEEGARWASDENATPDEMRRGKADSLVFFIQ